MAKKEPDETSDKTEKTDKTEENPEKAQKAKTGGGGIIQAAILAVGAGLTAFATVFLMPGAEPEMQVCATGEIGKAGAAEIVADSPPPEPINTILIPLDEILISIGRGEARRYLKINLTLIMDEKLEKQMADLEPQLRDAFSTYLRAVEVADFEDPAFYEVLRMQLHRRAQLIIGPKAVESILITDFLLR
jgi:flagellar protein FliL